MNMKDSINSAKVTIEYRRGEKQIFAKDLTDTFNEPAMYTMSKRGLDKVWAKLESMRDTLDRPMTLSDVMTVCSELGVKYHYWCMMD